VIAIIFLNINIPYYHRKRQKCYYHRKISEITRTPNCCC